MEKLPLIKMVVELFVNFITTYIIKKPHMMEPLICYWSHLLYSPPELHSLHSGKY